jgi:hypothetical protein
MPTKPRETIKEIMSTYPSDSSSPFFGEEMKPLARVYLARQRLYEKSCSDDLGESSEDDSGLVDPTASVGMAFAVNDTLDPCTKRLLKY